jgi:serine protease inhibitor
VAINFAANAGRGHSERNREFRRISPSRPPRSSRPFAVKKPRPTKGNPMRLSSPLLASLILAGCQSATGPVQQITELPRPLTAAEQEVISSSNAFAFDLMRVVNADEATENVFVSPLSVSMALGMTMNGAAGGTFDEMRETLGFAGLSQAEINATYRSLIELLLGLDRTTEMGIVNSVWYRQGFPFEQSFIDTVETNFDAEVVGLDFDDPGSVGRINGWVSSATNRRIDSIIDAISPNSVMFLINAIYFKGVWVTAFDRASTRADTFRGVDGAPIPVQMMNTDGTFRFRSTPEYTALELPYGNSAFTMTIVMPSESQNINDYLASLDQSGWNDIVGGMGEGEIMVSLPRFRLEYEKSLKEPLKALGMPTAFQPGGADFTGLSPAGDQLFISDVKHKTFVDVNEEGTEAAAVTSVEVRVVSMPPSVRIDRPFLFAIRERFSGTILFSGKIVAPSD